MLPVNLKNKIINTYSTDGKDLELEARFGIYKKHNFSSGVTRQTFNRVKAYFDKNASPIDHKSTDYRMGKVRKSVDTTGNTVWITKENIWKEEDKDHGIRYSMAKEVTIEPILLHFEPNVIREKNRSSYLVFNDSVRIDITIVNTINIVNTIIVPNQNEISFEIEVELVDSKILSNFESVIKLVSRLVLDTIYLYTEKEKNNIINEVNSILGSSKRGYIDHYPLVQARNLKLRDMVYGGLIGNDKTGYSITHKVDGIRKMLVFSQSGIWLISSSSISKISEKSVSRFNGTILDGELVPLDKRLRGAPKAKFWFLAFDTLSWDSDNSVQNKNHNDRLQYEQTIATHVKINLILVNTESFYSLETS